MIPGLVFIVGLALGSFLNVVIYRLPREESFGFNRSYCPECETRLKALDLVPVFSFLFLGGKCRYCGTEISYRYPIIELLTGAALVGIYLQYGLTPEFIIYGVFALLLIIGGTVDLEEMIIPNQITYLGFGLGLAASLVGGHLTFFDALLGAVVPAGLLLIIALVTGGMGMGDVKLAAVMGSFLGWAEALTAIFLGSLVGSLIAVVLLVKKEKTGKSKMPFGVFMALGGLVMSVVGTELLDLYWQLIVS